MNDHLSNKIQEIQESIYCSLSEMTKEVYIVNISFQTKSISSQITTKKKLKTLLSMLQEFNRCTTLKLGKYLLEISFCRQQSYVSNGETYSIFTGVVGISEKGTSKYILTTISSLNFVRIFVKLQFDSVFEDVVQNTSVRLSKVPNSRKRALRSSSSAFSNSTILHIDQFHVISKFQRQGCGAKVMGLIFFWAKFYFPTIEKCVVISPSSVGVPFYVALGASSQASSRNLEFVI